MMRTPLADRWLAVAAALLLPAAPAAFAGDDGVLTPEMVVDLASVAEVAMAPGGDAVEYVGRLGSRPAPEGRSPDQPHTDHRSDGARHGRRP